MRTLQLLTTGSDSRQVEENITFMAYCWQSWYGKPCSIRLRFTVAIVVCMSTNSGKYVDVFLFFCLDSGQLWYMKKQITNAIENRWVLLEAKTIMSPPIFHWMETIVFNRKIRSQESDKVSEVIFKSQQWFKRCRLEQKLGHNKFDLEQSLKHAL